MNKRIRKLLSTIYYNPSHSGSYGSVDSLWEATDRKVSKKLVREWLQSQDAYTLHKPARKRFPRNKYFVTNIDDLWQADLADMSSLKKENNNYKYLLTVIDVFSRHAWVEPLLVKTGLQVSDAFKRIFMRSKRTPYRLQTDKGKEFTNKTFQAFLKKQNIGYYYTNNPDIKASLVERFNRTLKGRMWKYFTHHGSYKYINRLQDMVHAYNHSEHSSLGMPPASVNENNVLDVWKRLYSGKEQLSQKQLFNIGDNVRISREKKQFEKGYVQNWSDEIFHVVRVLKRSVPVYVIADLNNEEISGTFYGYELQHVQVNVNTAFRVHKILETRGRGRTREVFVKWRGYPESFNSWIPAANIVKLS